MGNEEESLMLRGKLDKSETMDDDVSKRQFL
jgi:hypothetical protein